MGNEEVSSGGWLLGALGWLMGLVGAVGGCGGEAPRFVPPPPADIGVARVVWNIETPSGAPATCSEVGIESSEVLFGGAPRVVPCGAPQVLTFDNLTVGRYAAIVRLRKLGTAVFAERATNVEVVAGRTTTATVTFSYDPLEGTRGSLQLGWTIDGEDAATGCARVGGAMVHIEELPGSREALSAEVPCGEGLRLFEDLAAGTYGALLVLRGAAGQTIGTATVLDADVSAREVSVPRPAVFRTGTVELAKLLAEWTVDGVEASVGCAAAGADVVLVKAVPQPAGMVATVSATVACAAGRLLVEDVQPGTRPHRVIIQMYRNFSSTPPIPELVTSTVAEHILFVRGQTATVSVDLALP